MEKLLNLLNEFKDGKPFKFTGYDEKYGMFDTNLNMDGNTSLPEETIICKKFLFIKWLVDNNKISERKVKAIFYDKDFYVCWTDITLEYLIIMYASIQDDPIQFLISILK